MKLFPKVTVITVVYNAVSDLEKTLQSVVSQDFVDLEYIVVDGGSTDGTLEVISHHEDKITQWVSEPDKGIYDAMNKGAKMANGMYINYMNAGDCFAEKDVLSHMFAKAPENVDFIYGKYLLFYPTFTKYRKNIPMAQSWKMMPFSHQSLFVKTSIQIAYPLNDTYSIAADYHFIYNAYKDNYQFYDTDITAVHYIAGGHSEVNALKGITENFIIVTKRDKHFKIYIYYACVYTKQWLIESLKKVLPIVFFQYLMKLKNILQGKSR